MRGARRDALRAKPRSANTLHFPDVNVRSRKPAADSPSGRTPYGSRGEPRGREARWPKAFQPGRLRPGFDGLIAIGRLRPGSDGVIVIDVYVRGPTA